MASPDRCGGNRQSTPVTACAPLAHLRGTWPIERAAGLPAVLEILHGAAEVLAAGLLCLARRSALRSSHVNAHTHCPSTALPRPIHGPSKAHPLPTHRHPLAYGCSPPPPQCPPPLQTHPGAPVQPNLHYHAIPTAHGRIATALRRAAHTPCAVNIAGSVSWPHARTWEQ